MSLSEEERHILDEMERSLRRHDRAFVDRVNSANLHSSQKRARWAMIAFMAGFALLLVAFGSSVLVGALGFLVMLGSTLVFVRYTPWRGPAKHHRVAEERNTPDR
jgi:fatty acid desaturase